jgi:hypothetical protein
MGLPKHFGAVALLELGVECALVVAGGVVPKRVFEGMLIVINVAVTDGILLQLAPADKGIPKSAK